MATAWLERVLDESRARGFLGPGPVDAQIRHAEGFALVWEGAHEAPPARFLDMGSGGGLPGLVLASRWGSPAVLLDSGVRRTEFLIDVLGWPGAPVDVEVVSGRAEVEARNPRYEAAFELVVARSFGSPAVTAECATRFGARGAWLIVAEPPHAESADRWPEEPLGALGWRPRGVERPAAAYQVLEKVADTPERYPRAVGRPAKRPLF